MVAVVCVKSDCCIDSLRINLHIDIARFLLMRCLVHPLVSLLMITSIVGTELDPRSTVFPRQRKVFASRYQGSVSTSSILSLMGDGRETLPPLPTRTRVYLSTKHEH